MSRVPGAIHSDSATDMSAANELASILKNPQLVLQVDYVLILEWLPDGHERTGEALSKKLREQIGESRVEYRVCKSIADIERALSLAIHDVPHRGVPIVHLEAHGHSPSTSEAVPEGFVGPGPNRHELLNWAALGGMLRPLNIASRFNLVVVCAACYGEGTILGMEPGLPAPFTAIV